MSRERLIWRPNNIPLDVWEAMSREDQIAWWDAAFKAPPQPKPHMKKAIYQYQRGATTKHGFLGDVYALAAEDEMVEFLEVCPADLLSLLKESLAGFGPEKSDWPRILSSACHAPWVTMEQIEESRRREQQQIWDGVRILKRWVK